MSYWSAHHVKNDEVEEHFDLEILDKAYQINLIGLIKYLDYPVSIVENRFGKIKNKQVLSDLSRTMPIIMFWNQCMDTKKKIRLSKYKCFYRTNVTPICLLL